MYKLGSGRISYGSKRETNRTAVRLLQELGERVVGFEATGARILRCEQNHDRLIAALGAEDMPAYSFALNGYMRAAREAYKTKKGVRSDAL